MLLGCHFEWIYGSLLCLGHWIRKTVKCASGWKSANIDGTEKYYTTWFEVHDFSWPTDGKVSSWMEQFWTMVWSYFHIWMKSLGGSFKRERTEQFLSGHRGTCLLSQLLIGFGHVVTIPSLHGAVAELQAPITTHSCTLEAKRWKSTVLFSPFNDHLEFSLHATDCSFSVDQNYRFKCVYMVQ